MFELCSKRVGICAYLSVICFLITIISLFFLIANLTSMKFLIWRAFIALNCNFIIVYCLLCKTSNLFTIHIIKQHYSFNKLNQFMFLSYSMSCFTTHTEVNHDGMMKALLPFIISDKIALFFC